MTESFQTYIFGFFELMKKASVNVHDSIDLHRHEELTLLGSKLERRADHKTSTNSLQEQHPNKNSKLHRIHREKHIWIFHHLKWCTPYFQRAKHICPFTCDGKSQPTHQKMPDAKVLGLFRSFKGTLHCWQLVQPAKAGTLIERYIDMGMWNNIVNSGFTSFFSNSR